MSRECEAPSEGAVRCGVSTGVQGEKLLGIIRLLPASRRDDAPLLLGGKKRRSRPLNLRTTKKSLHILYESPSIPPLEAAFSEAILLRGAPMIQIERKLSRKKHEFFTPREHSRHRCKFASKTVKRSCLRRCFKEMSCA